MSQKNLIIEFYCLPCDSEKTMDGETLKKVAKLQEGFEDEWATEEICWDCAREHQISLGDYYSEEECLKQEKEFIKRGLKSDGIGRWFANGTSFVNSYRLLNKLKRKRNEAK